MEHGSVQTTKGAPFYWAHMEFWKHIDAIDETEWASLKAHAIALYHAFLRYADAEGACFPSYDTLAAHIGCSRPTVIKTVRALEALNLLRVERSDGRDTTNRYVVVRQSTAVNDVSFRVNDIALAGNGVDCTVNQDDCLAVNDVYPNYNQELEPRELDEPLLSPFAKTAPAESDTNGAKPSRRKPETPAPATFPLTDKHYAFATAAQQLDRSETDFQTANFLDHHRAKDSRFRDWEAAWRTWIRNVDRFGGRSPTKPRWSDRRPGETEAQRSFRMSVI